MGLQEVDVVHSSLPNLCPCPTHSAEDGSLFWVRAQAESALGLGIPSSAETGCVQGGLEPGAEEGVLCCLLWTLPSGPIHKGISSWGLCQVRESEV